MPRDLSINTNSDVVEIVRRIVKNYLNSKDLVKPPSDEESAKLGALTDEHFDVLAEWIKEQKDDANFVQPLTIGSMRVRPRP